MKRILNFIDGQFRPPCSGRYLPNINPATGQVIAEIAESGPEDVDAAVSQRPARSSHGTGHPPRNDPGS